MSNRRVTLSRISLLRPATTPTRRPSRSLRVGVDAVVVGVGATERIYWDARRERALSASTVAS